MKRNNVILGAILIVLVTVIFAGSYLYLNIESDKSVVITVQTLTDSAETTGYIVKNEAVIDLSGGSFVRFYAEDGEKVSGRSYIASVYDNESDGNLLAEIEAINDKIKNLSDEYINLTMNDILKIESYIDRDVDAYFSAVYSGDMAQADLIKGRLTTLFNIKHSGKSSNDVTEAELVKERKALEAKLSSAKYDIASPMGGILTKDTDGLEGLVDFERATSISVGEFDELMKTERETDKNKCKIVDNYKWLLMCKVSSDYAAVSSVGRTVEITTDKGEEITGKIEYISNPEEGECIMTLSSDRDFFNIGSSRFMDVTLVFNKYKGFVIPTKAFHMYNNEYGVFVESGNRLTFKRAEVIYSDDEYTVVNPSGKTALKLYDNVLVEGDLSEFYD